MRSLCNIVRQDIFFSMLTNQLCVMSKYTAKTVTLLNKFGLKVNDKMNLVISIYNTYLKQYKEAQIIFRIFGFLDKNNFFVNRGFFRELDMIGLGFRLDRVTERIFYIRLGYSSGIYFFTPSRVRVNISIVQKKIFLWSCDLNKLNNLMSTLFLLRKPNPYRILGFSVPGQIVRLRAGKQR